MQRQILQIILETPLDNHFDYVWFPPPDSTEKPQIGQLVEVPFGARTLTGVIVGMGEDSLLPEEKLRAVMRLENTVPALQASWLELCRFAASYYQRTLGEVALAALPKKLREMKPLAFKRAHNAVEKWVSSVHVNPEEEQVLLHPEQAVAVERVLATEGFSPFLLHGVTGSGKTEVYLQIMAQVLASDPQAQVLIMVPEINLTPQLEKRVQTRFPQIPVAILHSHLSEGDRFKNWLAVHGGKARILLGTRLAVLASIPALALIIVDEEHDPSYKQQEGLRYSARDLAVWRAHQLHIPIVLGSATPSLESWQHVLSGRYQKLELPYRAVTDAVLPQVKVLDTRVHRLEQGLSQVLVEAVKKRMERKEQSLLFLNRRGYAPVLACDACGWLSACPRCSAFMVWHKTQGCLRCHHCALESRVPHACPTCGNLDLHPVGQGTQRLEESIRSHFPEARILRMDADSMRLKGSTEEALASVHAGEVDILVGTQMVAKGHDFQNLTLVGILNPDTALFSHDYRASERLFAQLLQVSGRAGRGAKRHADSQGEVIIQTRYPEHPIYCAVASHDYPQFAHALLEERRTTGLPPYMHQALLCAESRKLETALEFLRQAAAEVTQAHIQVNEAIPMSMTRINHIERAQLLVESTSRPHLQQFLREWIHQLRSMKTSVRWHVEVDPVMI